MRFVCEGLWHRPKERKLGPVQGLVAKVSMLLTAVFAYLTWWLRCRQALSGDDGARQVRR